MSHPKDHVDISPEQAMVSAARVLNRAVDGDCGPLTPEDATAVRAALWDARSQAARDHARADAAVSRQLALHGENDKLVAQVVLEEGRARRAEQRAHRAERDFDDAMKIIRGFVENKNTAKHWRGRASAFLEVIDRVAT